MQYKLCSKQKTILPEIISAGDYRKLSPADQLKYKRDAGEGEDNDAHAPTGDDLEPEEISDRDEVGQASSSGGYEVRERDNNYYSEDPYLDEEEDGTGYEGRKKVGGDTRALVSRKTGIDPEDYDPDLEELYAMIPQSTRGGRGGGRVTRSDE